MTAARVDAPHAASFETVLAVLGVDPRLGLSEDEAAARLARHGRNVLAAAPPVPAWRRFLAQFADLLVGLLLAAGVVSLGLWAVQRDSPAPYEALAIFVIVLINAAMGYVQEAQAERAAAALRDMTAAQAKVLRDGLPRPLPAAELVPGDVILIEEGDAIPADARLIETVSLHCNEAALTGESLPSAKSLAAVAADAPLGDRAGMVFSGATAISGRGRAVVVATGMATEMGRVARLLEETPGETTPLQVELAKAARALAVVVLSIAAAMIAVIALTSRVTSFSAFFDILMLGVALAVAAVPEGLPAVVTAALAMGVRRMARRNAIMRRLAAVETLGSATVIAADKTGTLTRNEMTVRRVVTASGRSDFDGSGYAPYGEPRAEQGGEVAGAQRAELERALRAAERANNAALREVEGEWRALGDPTEAALLVAARKAGLDIEALATRFPRLAEAPFSSERKLMSTVHADAERDRHVVFVKGAPSVLLERCDRELVGDEARPLDAARRAAIRADAEALAAQALRTLAVAYRATPPGAPAPDAATAAGFERDLVFLGLIGMIDPPREEARAAVAKARAAGVRPIMITGDHPRTAAVIAQELGVASNDRVVAGAEIARADDARLDALVREVSVFARVDPEHKLRIVQALQRQGEVVAMTGDGVNDAPALKTADIGVAMGINGTDVSKQAADMILVDDDFATIVAAIEEGRAIFDNIRKFLLYLLSSNIGEVMTMFFGVIFAGALGLTQAAQGGFALPLLATQILWINLITDGAPALALGVDPADPDAIRRPPRPRGEAVLTGRMWVGIVTVGAAMAAATLLALDAGLPGGLIEGHGELPYARTLAFTTLVLAQLLNVFSARFDTRSAFADLFTNRWLWVAVALSLLLHVAAISLPGLRDAFGATPLSPADWGFCATLAVAALAPRELLKRAR